MAYDFTLQHQNIQQIGIECALCEIGQYLEEYGKQLSDFGLHQPLQVSQEVQHEFQRWNNNADVLYDQAIQSYSAFNLEKKDIYDEIIGAVINQQSLYLFIDGKAGCGKTFLVRTICDRIRSLGKIVIPTATSAFAAQAYAGGRTTHSAFKARFNLIISCVILTRTKCRFLSTTDMKC